MSDLFTGSGKEVSVYGEILTWRLSIDGRMDLCHCSCSTILLNAMF